jgi:type II secretory pathway component PulF
MEKFSYEALDSRGRRIVAAEEARDRAALLLSLQTRGLHLIRWVNGAPKRPAAFRFRRGRVKGVGLLRFTQELAHLTKAGIPLDRALFIIADAATEKPVRDMALELREGLRGGKSLSDAMAARPEFRELYVNMVRVGEVGGVLDDVMGKLAAFLERNEEIKRFVVSSAIYPSLLVGVGILSVVAILGFVIPRFAEIFVDMGHDIPFSTRMLILASDLFREWWWALVLAAGAAVGAAWHAVRTSLGKRRLDRWLIRLPLLGSLFLDLEVSRFARTLGTLVSSGVPLLKALAIVRDVAGNHVVKEAVEHIYQQVRQGKRISLLIKETGLFPVVVVHMTALGEETGELGAMLTATADELDAQIQVKIKRYLAMLEPAAILFMGLVIGGMVISMLSAIFGINEIAF